MVWLRFALYFLGITTLTWLLTAVEIQFPGSLRLYVFVEGGNGTGTSEFSAIELVQPMLLLAGAALMAWIARFCPTQQPLAIVFGGLAVIFLIRELHYFLDRYLIDNLWQALAAVCASLVIVYVYRHRLRLQIALGRIWPSPGLTLMFAGAVIIFSFALLIGQDSLWRAILGENYQRVVKLAVEEFVELIGYLFLVAGSIEYVYQSRAYEAREPQPVAQKRREQRRPH